MQLDDVTGDAALAMVYANRKFRAHFQALPGFDAVLAQALSASRDPVMSQFRLAFWRGAVRPEANKADLPVDFHDLIAHHDVNGDRLAALVDGWEALLEDLPLTPQQLTAYANARGGNLFALAARIAGQDASEATSRAGAGWALVNFARHCSDQATVQTSLSLAGALLADRPSRLMPRTLKPFALLADFAWDDCRKGPLRWIRPASPMRAIRALGFVRKRH